MNIFEMLTSRLVWILIAAIVFAVYLVFKIRKFDEPFDENAEEVLETHSDDFSLPSAETPPISEPKFAAAPVPSQSSKFTNTIMSDKMTIIEDALKLLASQFEKLALISEKKTEASIPKNIQLMLEALPEQISQIQKNMSVPKASGPPVESPVVKEIAASIIAMQKQIAAISQNIAVTSDAKQGSGVPKELLQKLDALSELQNIATTITPFFQKIQGLNSQIDAITASLSKISKMQESATKGISPETLANLMVSIDTLKAQMENQKPAAEGGAPVDMKPMTELFTKQMEDFQITLHDLKKSIAGGSAGKGAVQDISGLLNAVQELRTAFNAATNAEEDLLSRITTKLDIIHQVMTSQTLSGGGSISSSGGGGDKDLF